MKNVCVGNFGRESLIHPHDTLANSNDKVLANVDFGESLVGQKNSDWILLVELRCLT